MDYDKNFPGETQYDKAFTEQEPAENNPAAEPVAEDFQCKTVIKEEPTKCSFCNYGMFSLILGICSFLVVFLIPVFGLALAAVGGVFGIVLGVRGRKKNRGYAWTGIGLSIIALVLVMIGIVLLCLIGWALITTLLSGLSQGYSSFGDWFGGSSGSMFPYGGRLPFYFD